MLNQIKNVWVFIIGYLFFWVILFVFHRLVFILYNHQYFENISLLELFQIFKYGLKLDISFASYISFVSFILLGLLIVMVPKKSAKILYYWVVFLIGVISLISIIDLSLYPFWETRINASIFDYLSTPNLIFASSSSLFILLQSSLGISIFLLSSFLFTLVIPSPTISKRRASLLFFISSFLLIIPIRGGFQTIPINVSSAYHSIHAVNNHASINSFWNFFQSIIKRNKVIGSYNFLPENEELGIINNLSKKGTFQKVNIQKDPNIVIIVWESLTAKITEEYQDLETVPFLNSLKSESIYFNNFFANGTRSDKGLVSIFSGYYPQAFNSIMKETYKSMTLPSLFEELNKNDYNCSFYYGGDTNFANMNSYFLENGIHEIIDGSEFSSANKSTKWGAFDHVVLEKLFNDIGDEKSKFCKTVFTITSHEPFEIPIKYKFGKKSEVEKFRSSHYYTDNSIKKFISESQKQKWWNNTLIIILADHGHALPKIESNYVQADRFKIPMVWTGGALNTKDTIIQTFCSQVDFSKSLLSQLNIENDMFPFSRNIFNENNNGIVHYIYTNGFGTVTKDGNVVFDMDKNDITYRSGNKDYTDSLVVIGKAITQNSYRDYLNR